MAKAKSITQDTFKEEISEGLVFVDFWAPWCGPCKLLEPIVEELAEEWDGKVAVKKLNTDEAPEIQKEFQVMSIPTMILFKDGEIVAREVGALPKDAIINFVTEHIQE